MDRQQHLTLHELARYVEYLLDGSSPDFSIEMLTVHLQDCQRCREEVMEVFDIMESVGIVHDSQEFVINSTSSHLQLDHSGERFARTVFDGKISFRLIIDYCDRVFQRAQKVLPRLSSPSQWFRDRGYWHGL